MKLKFDGLENNLFDKKELEIQPYETNEQKFKSRSLKETGLFSKVEPPFSEKIDVNLNDVWKKVWAFFNKEFYNLFINDLKEILYDLRQKNKYLIPLLKTKEYKDSNEITSALNLLNTFYNLALLHLLKTLCARKTLFEIYNKSNQFPFFQNEIFCNILRLDQNNLELVKELIHFRTQYSLLYQQVQKQMNE